MARVLENLEPKAVLHNFEELCQHPRPSKHEEKIAAFIIKWAKERNLEVVTDKRGNIVVRKPATPGMENRLPVCIQGHIDMVCEKNSDVEFDFFNDPIQLQVNGDWISARGTTLGADNGIGIAMGMALLESTDIAHPDLEMLCTLDEETGLTGAVELANDILKCKVLINLDSEEEGTFTIGCAGGVNTSGSYKYIADAVPADSAAYKITLKGLRGGHSGIEINDGRANSIKLLNRLIYNLMNKFNVRLSSINSGNKHNAIPREGFAIVTVAKAAEGDFKKYIEEFKSIIATEFRTKEPNLNLFAEAAEMPAKVMEPEFQKRLVPSFYAMPHGVKRMSPDIQGLVQTSTNFAIVETRDDEVFVLTSQRSSVETEKIDVAAQVRIALELGGAQAEQDGGYPAWEPNVDSPILKKASAIYAEMFGRQPKIEAIHAGLECGLIGEKYPGMDMLSFGPNLKDVHSPDERMSVSSLQNTWKLLIGILNNIPTK